MKTTIPIIIITIILAGVIVFTRQSPKSPARETAITKNAVSDVNRDSTIEQPFIDKKYQPYSAENLAKATENGGKAVIFFHAPWCPYCRSAEANFQENIDRIPDDVTILKTDYDTSTELKKKYGILSQHTFVQVDSTGNQITKWTGGETNELLANVKE